MKTTYATIIGVIWLLLLSACGQCEHGGSITAMVSVAFILIGAFGALVWRLDHEA